MASEGTHQTGKVRGARKAGSDEEFNTLLDLLVEAVALNKRADAGQFKNGTFKWLKQKLKVKFPKSGIKAKPHIESIIRRLKTEYGNICDMLNTSGFEWDGVDKKILADSDNVWNAYIQANKRDTNLRNYRHKMFPYFDRLMVIFGKDCATGKSVVSPADVVEDLDKEEYTHGNNEHIDNTIGLSDDEIQDVTQSMSVNQAKSKAKITHGKGHRVRKRSRGENALANSIDKFADKLVEVVGKSVDRMSDMAESVKSMVEGVKVVKEFYDDSRAIADELMKMEDLTSTSATK